MANTDTPTLKGKNIPAGVTVDLGGELGYDMFGNGLYVGECEVEEALGLGGTNWINLTVLVEGDEYTVPVWSERDYRLIG